MFIAALLTIAKLWKQPRCSFLVLSSLFYVVLGIGPRPLGLAYVRPLSYIARPHINFKSQ
jgi:hypothetical protein